MPLKRIGLTQRVDRVANRAERRDALDQSWVRLLAGLDALALPLPNRSEQADALVAELRLDGVIMTGGNDLAEAPDAKDVAPERDAFERELFSLCRKRSLPVLGICRGAQALNVFLGGRVSKIPHHVAVRHEVRGVGSGEEGWPERFEVNSFHGYAIRPADLARGLKATTESVPDRTVESFRSDTEPVAGLMWHPEREAHLTPWDRAVLRRLFGLS